MHFVITLVASDRPLNADHVADVIDALAGMEIDTIGTPAWLDPHKAVDLCVAQRPTLDRIKELRVLLALHCVDVFAGPADVHRRRKKLLLADMDSTIVTAETLDEVAAKAGPEVQQKIAALTARAMRGEIDFPAALRTRVAMLKGLSTATLQQTRQEIILTPGAPVFVQTMRAQGATCVLVSGGFKFFTGWVAHQVGFHADHANDLLLDGDVLGGGVAEPILGKEAKLETLQDYCKKLNLPLTDALAIGDGANDLPMLQAAGLGIGFHPKPILRDTLENCILYGDLTAALYAQGYRAADFAPVTPPSE